MQPTEKSKRLIPSYLFRFAICVSVVQARIQIHDLTNNPLAIVPLGEARVKIGYIRIVHPIDLVQIGNTIVNVNNDIQNNPFTNPLYELIQIKNYKLYETFLKSKPLTKREKRWDTVGTVWKWIAGSPDAEDLRLINSSMNSLILQNNKQILINQAIDKRIQEITDITNQVLKIESEHTKNHSIEINQLIVLSNLDSLQNQVETLEEAILMAKHGIPSSKLLSMRDFTRIASFLQTHDVQITSFEELLSQSKAQVMLNSTHIIYMLKVPQVSLASYEYDYVDSIIKSQKRISLNKNYILRNATHVYEMDQACEEQNNYFLCENSQLEHVNECIHRLTTGQHSNCTFEKVYSKGLVKRINDGTILINDAIVEVTSNCTNSSQPLNGSFLIQFTQCNLHINGELYSNYELTIPGRPYYPTTGLRADEVHIIDEPPVEYLQKLTLNHREELETLKLQNHSLSWKLNIFGSVGFSTVILIASSIAVFYYLSRRKRQTNIKVTFDKNAEIITMHDLNQPSSSTSSESKSLTSNPDELSEERKKELQAFFDTPTALRTIHM